jgi:hypothetical protein
MNEVDEYIKSFSMEVQERLTAIRNIILELPPQAPSYYPQPEGITAFKGKLSGYKTSKGTVQFPLNKPLPIDLILE